MGRGFPIGPALACTGGSGRAFSARSLPGKVSNRKCELLRVALADQLIKYVVSAPRLR